MRSADRKLTFRLSTHSSSEIAVEAGRWRRAAPALLTRMSRPPSEAIVSLATFCAPSRVRVSPAMNVAPLGVSACVFRAVTTTVAPPSMRRCAPAAPMPREPPVTSARRPANSLVRSRGYSDIEFSISAEVETFPAHRIPRAGLRRGARAGGATPPIRSFGLGAGELIEDREKGTRFRPVSVVGGDFGGRDHAVLTDDVAASHGQQPTA